MARKLMRKLMRWRRLEADAMQRYQDYIEYRQGRLDGRLGLSRAGETQIYLTGFELGRRDANPCPVDELEPAATSERGTVEW